MSVPNLDDLLAGRKRRKTGLDPETRKARAAEVHRRWNVAVGMATTALRHLHSDDYDALRQQALDRINADSGPLPGDVA